MLDRRFCFILGAGASVQSGIPSGKDLVAKWLRELHVRENGSQKSLEEWATAENLGIAGFEYDKASSFYPHVFERRFSDDPEVGYAFLENELSNKDPSYGYSVLAQILSGSRHQVVITPNFDNLVSDALAIYTRTFPLVCGHESLTRFVRPFSRRPLIAKIHRDLLLEPINSLQGTALLATAWKSPLTEIFKFYTPIVIGYGGNDGSLMDFLSSLDGIIGGMFWCFRVGSEPEDKVNTLVQKHGGRLVPIVGFDEIMLQIQQLLGLPNLSSDIESRSKDRLAAYRKQFETLLDKVREPGPDSQVEKAKEPVRKAAENATQRITKENNWWSWVLKARAESDPNKVESIYLEALKEFPDNPDLMSHFAIFLMETLKDQERAEKLFRRAMELNPNAEMVGNLALFLTKAQQNEEAAKLYEKALEMNPNNPDNLANYAEFLETVLKKKDESLRLFRKAVELAPNDTRIRSEFEKVHGGNDSSA